MPSSQQVTEKPSFLQAFQELNGIMFLRFPIPLRIWLGTLGVMNMGGTLLFGGIEVWTTAIIMAVSANFIAYLYQQHGFVKLLAAGHFLWPFMIAWIWFVRLPEIEGEGLRMWLTAVVVVDGLCVALDVIDLLKYINGDRKPTFYWDKTKAQ